MPAELTLEQNELFAYTLYSSVAAKPEGWIEVLESFVSSLKTSSNELTQGNTSQEWRKWSELRSETYKLSDNLIAALTAAGFEIKPPTAKATEKALDVIMTNPARKAYELDRIPRIG